MAGSALTLAAVQTLVALRTERLSRTPTGFARPQHPCHSGHVATAHTVTSLVTRGLVVREKDPDGEHVRLSAKGRALIEGRP